MNLHLTDFVILLAAVVTTVSYMTHEMIMLRSITVLGYSIKLSGIVYQGLHDPGMTAEFIWTISIIIINAYHLIRYWIEKKLMVIPDHLKALYKEVFSELTVREFKNLFNLGLLYHAATGEEIIKNNTQIKNIMLVLDGSAGVYYQNQCITCLTKGQFMGEMSYLSKKPTTGSVKALTGLEYICWDRNIIEQIKHKDPHLYVKILSILGVDIAHKLIASASDSAMGDSDLAVDTN